MSLGLRFECVWLSVSLPIYLGQIVIIYLIHCCSQKLIKDVRRAASYYSYIAFTDLAQNRDKLAAYGVDIEYVMHLT